MGDEAHAEAPREAVHWQGALARMARQKALSSHFLDFGISRAHAHAGEEKGRTTSAIDDLD